MKLSSYGYIFNATLRQFDIEKTVENFTSFFDEVVLATVPSEDDTRERLSKLEKKYSNLKIVETNIKIIGNNRFDGQLKTVALQNCKNKYKVIVDCDETIPLGQRPKWDQFVELLEKNQHLDGLLIPVIDLFGSKDTIRANQDVGLKFRLHGDRIVERGVLPEALHADGSFRTDLSDSTEPVTENGQLGAFTSIVGKMDLHPLMVSNLVHFPYVIHHGSLDLQRRAKIGREFWKDRWEERSNRAENVVTDVGDLIGEPTVFHNLPIE